MKCNYAFGAIIALGCQLSIAAAPLENASVSTSLTQGASIHGSVSPQRSLRLRPDGIYKFKAEKALTPVAVSLNGESIDNPEGGQITFNKGEPVSIQYHSSGNYLVTPILTEEERGVIPEQILITAEEFDAAGLEFLSEGDPEYLVQNFSAYMDTLTAARYGGYSSGRRHGTVGRCKAWVNSFLVRVGLIPHRVGGIPAWTMAGALTGLGWQPVKMSHRAVGTTCVWRGGWHGYGHTQTVSGKCPASRPFQDDKGCHPTSYPGKKYRLVGCYAKNADPSVQVAEANPVEAKAQVQQASSGRPHVNATQSTNTVLLASPKKVATQVAQATVEEEAPKKVKKQRRKSRDHDEYAYGRNRYDDEGGYRSSRRERYDRYSESRGDSAGDITRRNFN